MDKAINYIRVAILLIIFTITPLNVYSADESVLFTAISPDALLVLDRSGSMENPPPGQYLYTASSSACGANSEPHYAASRVGYTYRCDIGITNSRDVKYGVSSCVEPFYKNSNGSFTTDCSKKEIAKRAVFAMFDEDNNGTIQSSGSSTDDANLNIRFGFMSFYNCGTSDDTAGNTSSGCITLSNAIGDKYSQIYCGSNSSCTISGTGGIRGLSFGGYTPLASSLREAKLYLDTHKAADSAAQCREKFVIFITDGADTISCQANAGGSTTTEWESIQYKRRRATVDRAKALADAGYKVFVVGFGGDMPFFLRNTLNWAAYYGGTDNPLATNTGDTSAYTPYSATSDMANPTACSTNSSTTCYQYECSSNTGLECSTPTLTSCTAGTANCYCFAQSNDPGGIPTSVSGTTLNVTGKLDGYAFIATNSTELDAALRQAVNMIRSATYSYTNISVSTARTTSENDMYVAYMQPVDDEPFWVGRLKKYAITSSGDVGTMTWDAGVVLQAKSAGSRSIKTFKNGNIVDFTTSNITPGDLGLASTATAVRDAVVGYFRGETTYNEDNWKLGDIWHSNPVVITTPSAYYEDKVDTNNAFAAFRSSHQRTSGSGRIVVVGANDGQIHFFRTSDGDEIMSFIPPNMLHKLPLVAHSTHPTGLTHQYLVDGPISAADVWLGSGSGTSKSSSDWKTILVTGLGRGSEVGSPNLWSSNSSCTPDTSVANNGYSQTYSSTYSYYCGYYAFDITNTGSPSLMWRMNPTANQQYFGASWSRMAIGRVKISGNEKWVGFVGGGGYNYSCSGGQPSPPNTNWGKGFFVVDLQNGNILWSYTKANNSGMDYSIAAPAGIVDTDGDGFIDTAYIGDLGGNMWRFKFCLSSQSSCSTSNWQGGYLYQQSSGMIRPIFTGTSVSKDPSGNLWVYWGSGDKECPADPNAQERFYAVKDDRTTTFTFGDLDNLTGPSQTYDPSSTTKKGWSMQLAGNGEKILADPVVFAGSVYFTTYTPASGSTNPCQQAGTPRLYGMNYMTGGGALSSGARSLTLSGTGIPSSPVISINPNTGQPDMYVTSSGGSGVDSGTYKVGGVTMNLPTNKTRMLFWRDKRLQ